jgi:hypothetical protein
MTNAEFFQTLIDQTDVRESLALEEADRRIIEGGAS